MKPEEQIAWLARELATVYFMKRGIVSIKVRDLAVVKGASLQEAIEGVERIRATQRKFNKTFGFTT